MKTARDETTALRMAALYMALGNSVEQNTFGRYWNRCTYAERYRLSLLIDTKEPARHARLTWKSMTDFEKNNLVARAGELLVWLQAALRDEGKNDVEKH